jgi:hypothetical protein
MGSLRFDLVDAISFRRDRVYVATVLITLAVTIGATTAVFSIVNGVLLEPLAYREPHRLVALREIWRQFGDHASVLEVNERHFGYWREHARAFDSMAVYRVWPANLTGAGEAMRITVARSSGSLFDVLRTPAALGRTLTLDDEPPGRPDIAVISDGLWRRRFAADPAVIGRTVGIDGHPYAVVGVMPAGFRCRMARLTAAVDVVVPLRVDVGWVGDHRRCGGAARRRGERRTGARDLDVLQAQIGALATQGA